MTLLGIGAVALYVLLLVAMLVYGLNSVLLVVVHARGRKRAEPADPLPDDLPLVVVQLPVFNERNVVERLLEAVGKLDWPKDKLEIQLLDDSTDNTPEIAARVVARLEKSGLRIKHIRRSERGGFKAGALAHGMTLTDGELFAIFDADFVPPPDFVRRAVGRFADPQLAAVQGRWTHLNRGYSALTRAQALAIDAHFGVEQGARCWAGWFMNFNGSGGIWRRAAIEDAGGWSADTLTEDLELSYRVQLHGWRIVYDSDLTCPAELPMQLSAFKNQQRRWATGSMQTARKLLGSIWRSKASFVAKLQATLHLTHYAVHLLIALTALLSVPCLLLPGAVEIERGWWSALLPLSLALSGPTLQHFYAQRVLEGRRVRLRDLGMLLLLGLGIAVSNGWAVLRAFRKRGGAFVRTPKLGLVSRSDEPASRYRPPADGLQSIEAILSLYCLAAGVALFWVGLLEIAPFMLLDAAGFAYVAATGWREVRA